jgi:hypothetical protein
MSRFHVRRPSLATTLAITALIVALGGTNAYATVTTFMLGATNTSNAPTALTASTTAWPTTASQRLLQLTNTNTAVGATAMGLNVASGHAPFTVNSGTKVTNLNADRLDGIDSSALKTRVLFSSSFRGPFTDFNGPNNTYANSFTTHGGTVLFLLNGSGFTDTTGQLMALCIGVQFVSTQEVCADGLTNELGSHKTLVEGIAAETLAAGTYNFGIGSPTPAMRSDSSDYYSILILELPA